MAILVENDNSSGLKSSRHSRGPNGRFAPILLCLITPIVLQLSTFSLPNLYGYNTSSFKASVASYNDKTDTDAKKYAIVHLLTKPKPAYLTALLTSAHRLVQLHEQSSRYAARNEFPHQLDLVVMMPEEESSNAAAYQHPFIRFVFYDEAPIVDPLKGKKYWIATMHKLVPLSLQEYDAIFFLDLDVMVVQPLTSVFLEFQPPAMTYWDMYPKYSFNSGCQLMKPSQDIFNDAIYALHQLWPNTKDNKTADEISNRANAKFLTTHQKHLPPAAHVANWRGDQEFLHSFYNILPNTSQTYGPIHPLPHGYCARSATVRATTEKLLAGTMNDAASLADGGLLHLYGGYGHDGQGHWIHETRKEQGYSNLVALHFTIDKPWYDNLKFPDLDNSTRSNATMTPQERCPTVFYHMEFWVSALEALVVAKQSIEYGDSWTSKSVLELLDQVPIVSESLEPELQHLKKVLMQKLPPPTNDFNVTLENFSYKPLIGPLDAAV